MKNRFHSVVILVLVLTALGSVVALCQNIYTRPGSLTQLINVTGYMVRDAYDCPAYSLTYHNLGTQDLNIDSVIVQLILIQSEGPILGPFLTTVFYNSIKSILQKSPSWTIPSGQNDRTFIEERGYGVNRLFPDWPQLLQLLADHEESTLALYVAIYYNLESPPTVDKRDVALEIYNDRRFGYHFLAFIPKNVPQRNGNILTLWLGNKLSGQTLTFMPTYLRH